MVYNKSIENTTKGNGQMNNLVLLANLIARYNALAFTHNYIFGFIYENNVYAVKTGIDYLSLILKVDKASRGAGMSLRFSPTREIKNFLFTNFNPELVCSEKFFKESCETSKYNKGEIFEKLYTEKNGQVWTKDNKKFTECGDIEINGISYQIKYEKATFTNEQTLLNLENKGR